MIEVFLNLFVGNEADARTVLHTPGWYVVHACKEPFHRQALGYTGRGAPKDHPEYLVAKRDCRLILNLVDAPNPAYIPKEVIDAALEAIHQNISQSKVLVHCNQGMSRSPTIALLYLAGYTSALGKNDFEQLVKQLNPAVQATFDWLIAKNQQPYLTGSGASVYCKLANQKQAEALLNKLPSSFAGFQPKGWITKSCNQSLTHVKLMPY